MAQKLTPAEMHELVLDIADLSWRAFVRTLPGLPSAIPLIKYNNRLRTTAGRAFLEKGYIDLSTRLIWLHGEGMLRWTIPHEFGHIAAWRMKKEDGHGPEWKRIMRNAGFSDSRCWTVEAFNND